MFKRTLSAIAVGAALIAGSMSSAQALEIQAGDYKFTFDGYVVGTADYGNTLGVKCTTKVGCDAVPGISQASGTVSDTAGILTVVDITRISTASSIYTAGDVGVTIGGVAVGPYLTAVFSGIDDYYVDVVSLAGTQLTGVKAIGGQFEIFSNATNYDPTLKASANLDALTYTGISGGTSFLTGIFAPGAVSNGDLTTSYFTTFVNSAFAGTGQAFLDFTGGAAFNSFNTKGLTNANGGLNDAFLTVTYDDVNGVASSIGWDAKAAGQFSSEVQNVPEPGSLALISLAMLGLGATTARRRNKKS